MAKKKAASGQIRTITPQEVVEQSRVLVRAIKLEQDEMSRQQHVMRQIRKTMPKGSLEMSEAIAGPSKLLREAKARWTAGVRELISVNDSMPLLNE